MTRFAWSFLVSWWPDTPTTIVIPSMSGLSRFQSVFHLNEYPRRTIVAISVQMFFVLLIWKLTALRKIIYFTIFIIKDTSPLVSFCQPL
ncbi:hypothetical protein Ac2012v2_003532 [Leucoagaricus gongylophorus]